MDHLLETVARHGPTLQLRRNRVILLDSPQFTFEHPIPAP